VAVVDVEVLTVGVVVDDVDVLPPVIGGEVVELLELEDVELVGEGPETDR